MKYPFLSVLLLSWTTSLAQNTIYFEIEAVSHHFLNDSTHSFDEWNEWMPANFKIVIDFANDSIKMNSTPPKRLTINGTKSKIIEKGIAEGIFCTDEENEDCILELNFGNDDVLKMVYLRYLKHEVAFSVKGGHNKN